MSACELKKDLARLKLEQKRLVTKARNEVVISDMLMSKEEFSKADQAFLEAFLTKRGMELATEIHNEYMKEESAEQIDILRSAIAELKKEFDTDSVLSVKMQTVVLNRPSEQYSRIELKADRHNVIGSIRELISNIINFPKDEKIAKRKARLEQAISDLQAEAERPDANHRIIEERIATLEDKLSGNDIVSALMFNKGAILSNTQTYFPPIMAVHESYDNKGGTGGKSGAIRKQEIESGYKSSFVDGLRIKDNTIVSIHGENISSDFGDEISPLAILFGTERVESFGDKVIVPDFVKNIIKINSIAQMEDVYKSLSHPAESTEFNKIWNLDPSSSTYESDFVTISSLYAEGVIPRSMLVQSLGTSIYKDLPVKFSSEIGRDLEQKAITELGLYAVKYMHNTGLIIDLDKQITYNDNSKTQSIIAIKHDDSNKIMGIVSALQYLDLSHQRSGPSFDGPIEEVPNTMQNSFINLPKSVKDKLLTMQSKPLQFTSDVGLLYDLHKQDKSLAYAMAGILDIDTSANIYDQKKEYAKINYSKMQIDDLMRMYEESGLGANQFYLPYTYTVSGRYMINSILNPQESKITRFLVTSDDLRTTIARNEDGSFNEDDMHLFKLGLSQAFGLDPDKTMDSNAIAKLDKIVKINNDGTFKFADTYKDKPSPFKAVALHLLKIEKNGIDHLAASTNGLEDVEHAKFVNAMMELNRTGEGFHAVQGILALMALSKHTSSGSKESFVSNFSMESDAITSGMILTLMQIGTESALDMAAKGGVYTKETVTKWEKAVDTFNAIPGVVPFIKLTNKDGSFKITHGWLKDFSKHVSDSIESNESIQDAMGKIDTSFADFYETVGNDANEKLSSLKKSLLGQFKKVAASIEESKSSNKSIPKDVWATFYAIKNALHMSNFVGKIDRKLAKSPVMVYIYGSMLSSIKKKLVNTIVVPKLYSVFNKPSIASLQYDDFMVLIDKFPDKVVSELGLTQSEVAVARMALLKSDRPKFERYNGQQFVTIVNVDDQLMSNLVIDKGISGQLQKASDNSLGVAFETGFKRFGEIDSFRESVKALEIVRFAMFKYKYKKAINKVIGRLKDGENYVISNGDVSRIIAELERSGFGHSVEDINGGHQPLYKREKLEEELRAILDLGSNKISSAATEGYEYGINTGASGVITIHSLDGFIDSTSSQMFNLIRIYDGSVSGINKLNDQADAYNITTVEAATEWSSYNTQANLVSDDIMKLAKDGELSEMINSISDIDKDNIINTLEKLMGYEDINHISVGHIAQYQMEIVNSRLEENMEARDNGEREIAVLHQYLSDMSDPQIVKMNNGEKNKIKENAVGNVYGVYGQILKAVQAYKAAKNPMNEVAINDTSTHEYVEPRASANEDANYHDISVNDSAKVKTDESMLSDREAFIESMKGIMSEEDAAKLADEIISDC